MYKLSKDKAQAIATEYCTNGFRKTKALLAVGYSKNYANHTGLKLFDNDRVKTAIAKIQSQTARKTGYTIEQAEAEYELARSLAMDINQPASASTCITGKARLYGYDRDAGNKEQVVIVISPPKGVDRRVVDNEVQRDKGVDNGI